MAEFVRDTLAANGIVDGTYIEPFAGGASIAISLLNGEHVSRVIINDVDRSIYAFWYAVLNHPDELCRRIDEAQVNMETWEKQRMVQQRKSDADMVDLAFSTFFLNRTNRSGILRGGVIGGKAQRGPWVMDARFNKADLIRRIDRIALYKERIELHCEDAIVFLDGIRSQIDSDTLAYLDPPYYHQGSALYMNYYEPRDHERLAYHIQNMKHKWILTYDYAPEVIDMYAWAKKRLLSLSYTAGRKTRAYEMIAFSDDLLIPEGSYSSISIDSIPV
mgnify:CR=1 FL=1